MEHPAEVTPKTPKAGIYSLHVANKKPLRPTSLKPLFVLMGFCKFIARLYDMANDLANEAAIGFDTTGVYLELRSHDVLSSVVLPKYFKTGSVTSFVRQLHNYGFRTKQLRLHQGVSQSFTHANFLRGRADLCERITKRKSSSAVAKPAQESEYSSSGEEDNSSYNELIRINAQLTQENLNLWQRVKLLETQLIVEPVATAAAAAAPTLAAPPLFSPIVRSSPESGALCDDLEWFSSEFL